MTTLGYFFKSLRWMFQIQDEVMSNLDINITYYYSSVEVKHQLFDQRGLNQRLNNGLSLVIWNQYSNKKKKESDLIAKRPYCCTDFTKP